MATQIGSLARHTGVYGAGTIVGGIARAALVPIIARFVPAEEYGKASVVLILVALLGIVSELGLSSSLIKFVNEARDEDERRRVVATILTGSLAIALPIAVIAGLASGGLSRLLLGSSQYGALVLIGIAGGLGGALLQVGLAFERALARSFNYFLYTLAKGVTSLAVSIALVVYLKYGAAGLLLGTALPTLAIGAVIYARVLGRLGIRFSRPVFRSVFAFGGPLVPMNLAMWVLASIDIYLLRRFAATAEALSEVGLYQYAHEICLVLVLPITALNLAWPQFIFSNQDKPEGRALFARVEGYFAFFVIEGAFLLALFARQVVGVVGSRAYLGSASVIPVLAGSLVCYGFSIIFASGLYLSGRTRALAAIVAVSAGMNVLLNVILIPLLGKQGSALAALASNLLMMAVVLGLAQRVYRIPYPLGRSALAGAAAAAVVGLLDAGARSYGLLGAWPARLVAAVCLSFVMLAILGIKPGDLRSAARALLPFLKPPESLNPKV